MDMERAKVFGIGFHKTGTTSLAKALTILGYKTIHGDSPEEPPYGDMGVSLLKLIDNGDFQLPTIKAYDAFTDNPYFSIWEALDENYPNSKFILTIRDEETWIKSCIGFFGGKEVLPMRTWMFGEYADPSLSLEAKNVWLHKYQAHNQNIMEHFKGRSNDLLVMDLSKESEWKQLCAFLNQPIPKDVFPHENASALGWRAHLKKWVVNAKNSFFHSK